MCILGAHLCPIVVLVVKHWHGPICACPKELKTLVLRSTPVFEKLMEYEGELKAMVKRKPKAVTN